MKFMQSITTHLRHVIYGAIFAHFLRAIWRRMILGAPKLIIVPSKPQGGPGVSMFVSCGYTPPRKLGTGTWVIEEGLVDAMREEGYLFNTRTGGWDKDPNYVEPPENNF